jgi:hypothetical protein
MIRPIPENAPDGFEFLQAQPEPTAENQPEIIVRELPSYVGTPAAPFKTMPIMYFCRGGVSDRHWIAQRMRCIPEHLKHFAAEQYERLYWDGSGREQANRWLDAVARKYRNGV